MEFNIASIVRENIKSMSPYSSARHEYAGIAATFLDANENAFGSALGVNYNRYPDPTQLKLKAKISTIKNVPVENIFLGNGSDEAIDLLVRCFCEPGKDNIIVCPPTYGMYRVCADINNVEVRPVLLTTTFQLDLPAIENCITPFTRIIFICSPNNPTGNTIDRNDVKYLLNTFNVLVVVDEAYIDYSTEAGFINELSRYPNLVILQTMSKAWGLAGLRVGMAFANEAVINFLNKIKYPYNINTVSQQLILEALDNHEVVNEWIALTNNQKAWLSKKLSALPFVQTVYPSETNFLLVKARGARKIYTLLASRGIIVRDRSNVILCDDCLRITIGTAAENKQLIQTFKSYDA